MSERSWRGPGRGQRRRGESRSSPAAPKPRRRRRRASTGAGRPRSICEGVTKQFGALTAVNDVTFEVPDGSVFGLIGPNGAGKTTTFSMLAGYLAPTSGDIFVLDRSPERRRDAQGQGRRAAAGRAPPGGRARGRLPRVPRRASRA